MAIVNLGRVVTAAENIPPADLAEAAKVSGSVLTEVGTIVKDRKSAAHPAAAAPKLAASSTGKADGAAAATQPIASSKDASGDETVATKPMLRYVLFSLGCLAVGITGGLLLQQHYHPGLNHLPVLSANLGAFAVLYVMAQAIERLLVPVSWFGGGFLGGVSGGSLRGRSKSALAATHQAAMLKAYQDPSQATAQSAANAQHDVKQYSANLTATTFGLAAFAAMLVSGYAGVFLLHIAGVHAVAWLDVVVTGLAVAGGTKPLHDLISTFSAGGKPAV